MANRFESDGQDPTLPAIHNVAATMDGWFDISESPAVSRTPDYSCRQEQRDFIARALDQAAQVEYAPRTVRGPHHAAFNAYLQNVHTRLRKIGPDLTQEYLAPPGYRTDEVASYLGLPRHAKIDERLQELRKEKVAELKGLGAQLYLRDGNQELPAGLLDVPPYCKQGETLSEYLTARLLCVNACFRMLQKSLAGWAPDEDILSDEMSSRHGSIVVADSEYYKLFQTEAFKNVMDRTIKVVEVLGADFQTVNKLTGSVKARYPGAKVFAVANVGSQTALDKDSWHTCILQYANREEVVYHDSAAKDGAPDRRLATEQFMELWAIAYNRVQMVIAI